MIGCAALRETFSHSQCFRQRKRADACGENVRCVCGEGASSCQIQARALPACCWRCLVGCSFGWLAGWLAGQQRVGIPICKIHGSSAQSHSAESTPRPAAPCLAVYVSSPTDCLASWSSRRVALRRARRPSQSSDITLLTTILLTLLPSLAILLFPLPLRPPRCRHIPAQLSLSPCTPSVLVRTPHRRRCRHRNHECR